MNKVYICFLYYVHDRSSTILAIFDSEEKAKEYCKLPEGERPSGLCHLNYKEYEVK